MESVGGMLQKPIFATGEFQQLAGVAVRFDGKLVRIPIIITVTGSYSGQIDLFKPPNGNNQWNFQSNKESMFDSLCTPP